MDTTTQFEDNMLDTFDVSSSTASSIQVGWNIRSAQVPFVQGFRVHYQKISSTYVQYGPRLYPTENEYEIGNLVADTYYKICLVVYRNYTHSPYRTCTDASTTNWQLPVSIGSSIGAVLALSVIVLIVLLSRCQIPLKYRGKKSKRLQKYDTISSTYHDDQYEFSETVTHGNDEEYVSEFDDEAFYDVSLHDNKRPTRPTVGEKVCVHNGLCRGHIHSHSSSHNPQKTYCGRAQCSQQHPHSRQFRAYSIQADGNVCFFNQPCSPLAKEPRRSAFHKQDSKDSRKKEEQDSPQKESWTIPTLSPMQAKDHPQETMDTPTVMHKPHSVPQTSTFLDEGTDVALEESSTKLNTEPDNQAPKQQVEKRLLITDIDFDDTDLSKYGATGGTHRRDAASMPIEMTSNERMIALPESDSFDEHTV
ncbi:uncharacterized protein LOC127855543 [Dreissena polymorpha]|uniref:Fibronectin type-III domain-containing protein n=1 Tax=Dreissena polymorpha TaxID=45954 RepID=A0A9D4C242_DREPO|nr:uncharacterized protein LOC127855543 [Dreissena polymorpha]XP_052247230.1 uncharacterized protein LOC127855543 [Dreissena polymorpha]KAH3715693.1 hypothetical protein DPMN_058405 [Dreissena polymorpha]